MLASTKKLQAALGREPEDECRPLVHKLCPYLKGHTALLFTNLPHDEVQSTFEDFFHEDFARAGAIAMRTVNLSEGPVEGPGGLPFPHTMEHTLRGHGLPTKLNKGVIELIADHKVCPVQAVLFFCALLSYSLAIAGLLNWMSHPSVTTLPGPRCLGLIPSICKTIYVHKSIFAAV